MAITRRWRRWLLAGAGLALLVGVGGPFAYIHVVEGGTPARLTVSSSQPAADQGSGAAASVPLDGSWKVAGGSQAGYRVDENLFGQSHTAVGRTSGLTGQISISGTRVTTGSFTADLTSVKSDQSRRDNQFQGRIMDTADYPTATFTLTSPIDLGSVPADGVTFTARAAGSLSLRGTTKPVVFTVTAKRSGTAMQVSGQIPVTFADFNIPNPSFGPVSTDDHGILEFLLVLSHA